MPSKIRPRKQKQPVIPQEYKKKLAKIQLARLDFMHFLEYVIRDKQGRKVTVAPHQMAWWKHLRYCWKNNKECLIIAPMTFCKTVTIALALPLWLLGRNPNLRIMLVSATDKAASERLEEVGRYIKFSPEYKEVFPHVQADEDRSWNQHVLNIKRYSLDGIDGFVSSVDSSLSAYGYTANAGNGARADVIIPDDIASESNSSSVAKRDELDRLFSTQWLSRASGEQVVAIDGEILCMDSILCAIGTRYHAQDIYATRFIASPDAYCTMVQAVSEDRTHLDYSIYGAMQDDQHPVPEDFKNWRDEIFDNRIDTTKFQSYLDRPIANPIEFTGPGWALRSPDYLKKIESKLGQKAYQKGFRQRPQASGDLFFPNFLPGRVYVYSEDWKLASDSSHPSYFDRTWPVYIGCDMSSAKRRGTVIFILGIRPDGVKQVLDIKMAPSQGPYWDQPTFCYQLEAAYLEYRPRLIFVESNTLQEEIIKWFPTMGLTCHNVIQPFHTGKINKMDREIGLPGLDIEFSQGGWRVPVPHPRHHIVELNPKDSTTCGCPLCTFIWDMQTFTYDDIDVTPDTAIGAWIAKEASRMGQSYRPTSASSIRVTQDNIRNVITSSQLREISDKFRIPVGTAIYANGRFGTTAKRNLDGWGRPIKDYAVIQERLDKEEAARKLAENQQTNLAGANNAR
jgi:hypothetical protein